MNRKLCFTMALVMLFACTAALAAGNSDPITPAAELSQPAVVATPYTTEELTPLSEYLRSLSFATLNLPLEEDIEFVSADAVPTAEAPAESEPIYLNATLAVSADAVNCRADAAADAEVLCIFARGAQVTLLQRSGDWYQVSDGNYTGWCPADSFTLVRNQLYESEAYAYTEEELYWMALALYREAGSNWICDEQRILVGNVILNRVRSELFADSVYDVLHQAGQYPWVYSMNNSGVVLDEHFYELARRIFEGTALCPANVVFQAEFRQGHGVFLSFSDSHLRNTTYFCYL